LLVAGFWSIVNQNWKPETAASAKALRNGGNSSAPKLIPF
jgi:hypothetical protein